MKHKILLNNCIILCCLLFSGCEDIYNKCTTLYFHNNTDYQISVYWELFPPQNPPSPTVYPDTTLPGTCPYLNIRRLDSHSSQRYSCLDSDYQTLYNAYNVDTISIFVFSTDTLYFYGWPTVQKSYKILQRYDLSIEDCQRLSEKSGQRALLPCFPPSPEMKNMKMWPPYGTYDEHGNRVK